MTQPVNLNSEWKLIGTRPIKVWVIAPYVHTGDDNLDYYYDYTQSIDEYTRAFEKLEVDWVWQAVKMNDIDAVVAKMIEEKMTGAHFPIVLNLCDGDEINGAPGVSVIHKLLENNLVFTGSDINFYKITTSKIPMKQAFDEQLVPHASWQIIRDSMIDDQLFEHIGRPIIIKPAVSGGSMGVGIKNVVYDKIALLALIEELAKGYRGWSLMADGLIAEKYISGREFTVLICGNHQTAASIHIYEPVERVFHESLPDNERFLSFDRLWEIYESESAMPGNENFFEYHPVEKTLSDKIKTISKSAFIATGGVGYARADIRLDQHTGELFVLEINAQCGISEDENYTSIGAILKFAKVPFHELVAEIIQFGIHHHDSLILAENKNTITKLS
jgi:D-alanine-D-alanine ligase